MTESSFLAFYPQFSCFANGVVLPEYLRQANARFQDFGDDAEEARRLYTAHRLTLYAAAMPPDDQESDMESLAYAARAALQEVASEKVGEVSVTYSGTQNRSSGADFKDLDLTPYGLQLLSLLKQYGFAKYFP